MSLIIKNLFANLGEKQILKGIDLKINPGEVHALMGPNGSGKSTLAAALMGNPLYQVQSSKFKVQSGNKNDGIWINEKNIADLKPDERAREGLFLAFQNPLAIPGVNVANLLKTAYRIVKEAKVQRSKDAKKAVYNPALSVWAFNEMLVKKADFLGIPSDFLRRSLNEEFSGGEKKKLEMLQAIILKPKYAIFDEIDTGLDVDALKIVAKGIRELKKQGTGILVITHYQKIISYAKPDYVHILVNGEIIQSGGYKLAKEVEKKGYKKWMKIKK